MKRSISRLALLAITLFAKVLFAGETSPEGFTPLFDGKTWANWETEAAVRVPRSRIRHSENRCRIHFPESLIASPTVLVPMG